jgi:hypothetical protein
MRHSLYAFHRQELSAFFLINLTAAVTGICRLFSVIFTSIALKVKRAE